MSDWTDEQRTVTIGKSWLEDVLSAKPEDFLAMRNRRDTDRYSPIRVAARHLMRRFRILDIR